MDKENRKAIHENYGKQIKLGRNMQNNHEAEQNNETILYHTIYERFIQ